MKGRVIAVDRLGSAEAAALLVDGVLDDLLVSGFPGAWPAPGTIFRGIVDRPAKGQGGHFVKLPDGQRGYLRRAEGVKPGQALAVQVVGYPGEDAKAIPLTARLLFKGRYAIVTPGAPGINLSRRIAGPEQRAALRELVADIDTHGFGAILRSRAPDAPPEALAAEITALAARAADVLGRADDEGPARLMEGPGAHALARRDWPAAGLVDDAPGAFERLGVLDQVTELTDARIALPNGAAAWIEPTRALVAIDVNTGTDTTPAAGLKANLALARELPRQLRCRGLGGQVVIDLAPISKRDRRQLETALRAAFASDPVETALGGWTPLGNFELQRKRERPPIGAVLGGVGRAGSTGPRQEL